MKKILFVFATAALFAACSQNDAVAPVAQTSDDAVGFGVYSNTAVTRGAFIEAADLYGDTDGKGVGVFAFYQPANGTIKSNFTTRKYAIPDFMYNQQLTTTDGSAWTYSPVKYWPNNVNDQLSFFAYAPYKAATTWEDMGISSDVNGTKVTKTFAIDNDVLSQEDQLWADPSLNKSNKAVDAEGVAVGDKQIAFNFIHALSQVNLFIGVEQNTATGNASPSWTGADETTIVVNSVAFKGLYATYTCTYDVAGGTSTWAGAGKQDITLTTLDNQKIDNTWAPTDTWGYYNPMTSQASKNILFIAPQDFATQDAEVVITYTVTTTDAKLPGGKSEIVNVVTKKMSEVLTSFSGKFEQKKSYRLFFLIGMNQVTFDASLTPWELGGSQQINVPANE